MFAKFIEFDSGTVAIFDAFTHTEEILTLAEKTTASGPKSGGQVVFTMETYGRFFGELPCYGLKAPKPALTLKGRGLFYVVRPNPARPDRPLILITDDEGLAAGLDGGGALDDWRVIEHAGVQSHVPDLPDLPLDALMAFSGVFHNEDDD